MTDYSEESLREMMAPWLQTCFGKDHWPLDPTMSKMSIPEIAKALSRISRFGGHYKASVPFYSVAQHSVLTLAILEDVKDAVDEITKNTKLACLFHDAHEAYSGFGDVVAPLKRFAPKIKELEKLQDIEIAKLLSIDVSEFSHVEVRTADMRALATEARDLMEAPPRPWIKLPVPWEREIRPLGPTASENLFLEAYYRLTNG